MPKGYKIRKIKSIALALLLLLHCLDAISQYYYKDLVTTAGINGNFKVFKANKVTNVTLASFQGEIPVTEGFTCEQRVSLAKNEILTYTQTADRGESFFTAYYHPEGLLARTVDSTASIVSTTTYRYDPAGRLMELNQYTAALDKSSSSTERHTWQYSEAGKPVLMIRVKNNTDSTQIRFITDEKGNVVEENGVQGSKPLPPVYYYYDQQNRLTDVVRFNAAAKRLLPDYMFEYEETGELLSMTIVPEGSTDYQKWYYSYDDNGLKLVEFCYNKKNVLLGKVEYKYTQAG